MDTSGQALGHFVDEADVPTSWGVSRGGVGAAPAKRWGWRPRAGVRTPKHVSLDWEGSNVTDLLHSRPGD